MASHTSMKQTSKTNWLQTLQSPFVHSSCHIPDDRTTLSGTVSSRETFNFVPTSTPGITQTTHTSGLLFNPYPASYRWKFVEGAGGVYTGLSAGINIESRSIPNLSAVAPKGASVRLVSMGVRIIYEGTELNRAGKIFVGTAGAINSGISSSTINGGGTYTIDPLSVYTGFATPDFAALKSVLNNSITTRISNGVFEANWVPSGIPTYQILSSTGGGYEPFDALTGGAIVPSCQFNTAVGAAGVQSGQNGLVVIIENDTTSVASILGNTYAVEVITHWEVIPVNPLAVAYDLTPSASDFQALQMALNKLTLSGGFIVDAVTSNRKLLTNFRPRRKQPKPPAASQLASTPKKKRQNGGKSTTKRARKA